MSSPALELRVLGQFQVLRDGQELPESVWTRKKAKTLLKLLAIAPSRQLHREQIIEILWPEAPPELGLNNLHKTLHAARRALEPDLKPGEPSQFLLTRELHLCLAPEPVVTIDADAFLALSLSALRSPAIEPLEQALALYRDDLLLEDRYEDWATARREQLGTTADRLLEALAQQYEAAAHPRLPDVLRRLIERNALNEDAHRGLMRFYAATGKRHLALEQFRLCSANLRQELDVDPDQATVALHQEILAGRFAPNPPPPPTTLAPAPATLRPTRRRHLWLLAGGVSAAAAFALLRTRSPAPPRSLAIIPLRAESPALRELAEGLTEGLINSSSRTPNLRVMARATVYAYQGRGDLLTVGRELHVSTLLTGQLTQENNAYRVALELIDSADGARLWGRQFVSPSDDLAVLQSQLNSELAAALQPDVPAAPRPAPPATRNAAAYQAYLTGRFLANQRTRTGLLSSLERFHQALILDPNFALAHAGLADSYGLLAFSEGQPAEFVPQAKAAAQAALALDESLAEAHTSLAMVYALYEWRWPQAEAEFRRAIALNPNYATAHHWLAVHLGAMGRFDEAKREFNLALELDPLSPIIHVNSGYPALFERQFATALEAYDRALRLQPGFLPALEDRMLALERLPGPRAATEAAVAYLAAAEEPAWATRFAATATRTNYPTALREWYAALEARSRTQSVPPMELATLAARAGEPEKAFLWLSRALEQRSPMLVYAAVDPRYDRLRGDPRFNALLQRVGLLVP